MRIQSIVLSPLLHPVLKSLQNLYFGLFNFIRKKKMNFLQSKRLSLSHNPRTPIAPMIGRIETIQESNQKKSKGIYTSPFLVWSKNRINQAMLRQLHCNQPGWGTHEEFGWSA
jgi:hypothetical protein